MITDDLPSLSEEQRVLEKVKNGDRESAAQLYLWFGDKIYRQVILSRLPVIEKAEDVLRDTFRIAFERIDQFNSNDRSIFFWLRRIAINLVIDSYRKQNQQKKLAERILAQDAMGQVFSSHEDPPDSELIAQESRQLIEGSLAKINARYAQALRMRLLEDRSREECASALDVSVSTFDVLFHRACKAFRGNYPP
jgi:RNA polymerase sigma factor (sigma-70 family)